MTPLFGSCHTANLKRKLSRYLLDSIGQLNYLESVSTFIHKYSSLPKFIMIKKIFFMNTLVKLVVCNTI